MKEIAYISTPRDLVFDDDVLNILRTSRRRNARLGVTGLLCYDGRRFLQVVEGEDAVVDALLDDIRRDGRHTDLRTVSEAPITERAFAGFTMDYRRIAPRLAALTDGFAKELATGPHSPIGPQLRDAFRTLPNA